MRASKEMEKRMLIKRTISSMEKQIQALEKRKQGYIEAGKQAKLHGLKTQYNMALSGLRATIAQQKKIYEMKLNFEITSQMKDMMQMSAEFLKGMGLLSKDMLKLTKESEFKQIIKRFNDAMMGMELSADQMESFMDNAEDMFGDMYTDSSIDDKELEKLFEAGAVGDTIDSEIEQELANLKGTTK